MNTYLDEGEDGAIGFCCDGDLRLKNRLLSITLADELIVQKDGRYVVFSEGRIPATEFDYRILFLPKGWRDGR